MPYSPEPHLRIRSLAFHFLRIRQPAALAEPENYEARANLMWASSMALNTILDAGTVHGCACHAMEHEPSAYYDITHGHGLAIVTPRWLEYITNETTAPAIYRLGTKVFGLEEGLDDMDGAKKTAEAVAEHACGGGVINGIRNLNADDVENIYKMCL